MSKNYLLATPANWFFRRKVPPDLRNIFGRRELKVSLKTGSKQTALKRARVLAYKTDLIFETLRGSTMAGERIDIPGLTELIAAYSDPIRPLFRPESGHHSDGKAAGIPF